ncbi:class I SAM-dependent methyltransferase [Brevundimonas goettingensis]|uniref:Class I SAM-dependent methyltransferase n=1 Tax=Brevundimonas goettingensis TaxID=2774190 RepID=A0A975GWY5_9CAUL|nr:class I SAM-dependent methyltransferase [Brevundimonas goettingensis]QTC92319.1 class I SAM-dependent methyltransferase [Brevundimonas goettingensis]
MIALLKTPLQRLRQSWRNRNIFVEARTATRLARLEHKFDIHQREMRLILRNALLPDQSALETPSRIPPGKPLRNVFPMSSACRQEYFEQPWFAYWMQRIGVRPAYHRKQWEFAYIIQALWERDQLRPGSRGLGFGVGREPLSALFAHYGCAIVGTDMAHESAHSAGWTRSVEHAASLEGLRRPDICDDQTFALNVSFQVCDMNAIDQNLKGFDFCWSACAFEHLGSIDLGLDFVENSLATLKPGGWAIHTTELNLSSNTDTLDHETTVLFRRRDFERLARRLEEKGHRVAPLDFTAGDRPMDQFIDVPPYHSEPSLVLALQGYATTSFGLIVQKAA